MANALEKPSVPATPRPSSPAGKSTKPTSNSASLPIHTMKDDLREAKQGEGNTGGILSAQTPKTASNTTPKALFKAPVRPPAPPSPQSIGVRSISEPATPTTPEQQKAAKLDPLVELPFQQAESGPQKKKADKLLVVLIAIFVISALAAAGVWAWIFFAPNAMVESPIISEETAPKTLSEVIPNSSLLVAYYQVADEAQRSELSDLWGGDTEPTMQEVFGGNPRLLLEMALVGQFAYVLLPGDPRLYIVVESSSEVEQFLAEHSNLQSLELGQWRVLHSFSTDLYADALTVGTRADSSSNIASLGTPITLYVKGELLSQLHDKVEVLASNVNEFVLSVELGREGNEVIARFAKEADAGFPFAPGVDIAPVLAQVPADATFIRTGSSFANQAYRVTTPGGIELMEALTGPYAYYERTGDDGALDVGAIAAIPTDLATTLSLPDTTIESLLPILHTASGLGIEPSAQLAFTDATYNDVPLRYVNVDTPQLALDYSIFDGLLAISSSKEGMLRVIDVHRGTADGANTTWGQLEVLSRDLGPNRAFGMITQPALKRLLPAGEAPEALPFAIAFDLTDPVSMAGIIAVPTPEFDQ